MRKAVMILASAVFVALAAAAIFLTLHKPQGPVSDAQVNVAGAEIGGPFALTDQTGARVTSDALIGGPVLIYFGYTFCPDICPVDVAVMAETVDLLAAEGVEVTPVFISVDPERDTQEALAYYAEAMHPKMVALSGTEDEVRAAADAYKVYFERVDLADSAAGYLMSHSTFTYLVTPDGLQAVFRNKFPAKEYARAVAEILANAGYQRRTANTNARSVDRLISGSDDYEEHKEEFAIAVNFLLDSGQCVEDDFKEIGGWVKSMNHKAEPIYFVYCGGSTAANRLYLNTETGEISR